MKIDYTKLTFTELIDKIEVNRFFDLPRMVREAFRRLTPQAPKYKVYTALLTQTGTDAPVATVLENTLNMNISWEYDDVGYYIGIPSEELVETKSGVFIQNSSYGSDYNNTLVEISSNLIFLQIYDQQLDARRDNSLNNTLIEIRVYN